MFGPDYEVGACPGCSNLGDELDATRVHLSHRDVTLICFSRAPIDRLIAYKERMGWQFPYVSTYGTEFPFDFGLALTPEQAQEIPEVKEMVDDPPEWLEDWGRQVGAKLEDGLREGPSFIAFARENGTVYHTYTVIGSRPVRRAVPLVPARANAEGRARGAPRLAQGRVPRLISGGAGSRPARGRPGHLPGTTRVRQATERATVMPPPTPRRSA